MNKKTAFILVLMFVMIAFAHYKYNLCIYQCDFTNIETHKIITKNKVGELAEFCLSSKEEAEKKSLLQLSKFPKIPQVPFGLINHEWKKFTKIYKKNKNIHLYFFKTEDGSWKKLYGREGYILIYRNRIIDIFISKLS